MTIRRCIMRLAFALAAGFAALTLGMAPTLAQNSSSSQFRVTGTVAVSCTVSTGALAFPTYTGAVDVPAKTTTNVKCTGVPARPWEVEYDPGQNSPTNSCSDRNMADTVVPPNLLNYNLFDDPAFTNILGRRGEVGCVTQFGPPGVAGGSHTVFGLIKAGQSLPAGPYSDVVTVTVWWP